MKKIGQIPDSKIIAGFRFLMQHIACTRVTFYHTMLLVNNQTSFDVRAIDLADIFLSAWNKSPRNGLLSQAKFLSIWRTVFFCFRESGVHVALRCVGRRGFQSVNVHWPIKDSDKHDRRCNMSFQNISCCNIPTKNLRIGQCLFHRLKL